MVALLPMLLGCAPSAAPEAARVADTRPNLLVVTLDTTRADHIGVYGGPAGATPNLDALAREGTVFTRAYTVTPLTIPTHSTLHTGLLPPRHGVRDNGDHFLGPELETVAERLQASGYATMASVGAEVTSRHWGFDQGFDAYHDDMGVARRERNRWAIERPGREVVDDALAWLAEQDGERPWFAWVHLFDAHHPYEPEPAFAERFPKHPYLAEIAGVDAQVGRLLGDLRARGALEQTWVVVLADHGEGLGEHGESLHGTLLYDTTTRIPLILRPPGGQAVLPQVAFAVSTVDVGPTLLDAGGVSPGEALDGISLRPWVEPSGAPVPAFRTDRAVYVESLYAWHHYGWAPQRAVVDPIFKLIDGVRPELYARTDAAELEDLSALQETVVDGLQHYIDQTYGALVPATGAGAELQLSLEQAAQLEALGYMTGGRSTGDEPPPFRGELPAPISSLPVLKQTEQVRVAKQQGDLEAAERAARAVLRQAPGLGQVQQQLATILEAQGRLEEALEVAVQLDASRPSSNTRALLGRLRLRGGDTAGGLDALRSAVELDPYVVGNWMALLLAVWSTGDRDAFAERVSEARARLPDEPAIAGLEGVVLALRGDRVEAERVLELALSRDPGIPVVQEALARLAIARGDAERGEALLRAEIRTQPPALSARRELVRLLAEQQRHADQVEALERLAEVERPPSAETAWSHAQALYNLGRHAEAETSVDRCLTLAPRTAGCWLLRANVLAKLGRTTEAQEAFVQAKALRGD